MSEVILHVGTHKTGSTSIQQTLSEYSKELAQSGVVFGGTPKYADFFRAFTDDPRSFHHYYRSWHKNAKQKKSRNVIRKILTSDEKAAYVFSSEDISLLSEHALTELNVFLRDECGCSRVRVICYMREPLEYLNSSIQEFVKQGMLSLDDILDNDYGSYRLQGCPGFSGGKENILRQIYFNVPAKLIRSFGSDAVRFVKFEKAVKNGLTRTLLSQLSRGNIFPWMKEKRANVGVSHEASILLAEFNRRQPTLRNNLKINYCRKGYKSYIKFLMALPGEKSVLLDATDIDLPWMNSQIEDINNIVGSEILSHIDTVPEKYVGQNFEFSDVAQAAIEGYFEEKDEVNTVLRERVSIDKIVKLNRLMEANTKKRFLLRALCNTMRKRE